MWENYPACVVDFCAIDFWKTVFGLCLDRLWNLLGLAASQDGKSTNKEQSLSCHICCWLCLFLTPSQQLSEVPSVMRLHSVGARPTLTPCNALLRTLHLNLSVLFTDDENIASPQTINSSALLALHWVLFISTFSINNSIFISTSIDKIRQVQESGRRQLL